MTDSAARSANPTAFQVSDDGMVQVPGFELPFTTLASAEARSAYATQVRQIAEQLAVAKQSGAYGDSDDADDSAAPKPLDAEALRKQTDENVILPNLRKVYAYWKDAVEIEPWEVDGIYTEVFTPTAGIAPANAERVLINVHGGGYVVGGRTHGQLESIPIAATGKIKVVSIDYRMAPEHTFPAASEDTATVYRRLLQDYAPENIGIYGSSAGGMLTAQVVPWFAQEGLPLPGAIGMFGGTGQPFRGDSVSLAQAYYGTPPSPAGIDVGWPHGCPYFKPEDLENPLVFPTLYPEQLSIFPPSLLISGTRAGELGSMVDAHNKLTLAGVQSRLHIWDGLGHCFYVDPDLPESHEFEQIAVAFFAEQLGKQR